MKFVDKGIALELKVSDALVGQSLIGVKLRLEPIDRKLIVSSGFLLDQTDIVSRVARSYGTGESLGFQGGGEVREKSMITLSLFL